MTIVFLYIFVAIFAPYIAPYGEAQIFKTQYGPWDVVHIFGTYHIGLLYGIVFVSHQIGSFLGAYL